MGSLIYLAVAEQQVRVPRPVQRLHAQVHLEALLVGHELHDGHLGRDHLDVAPGETAEATAKDTADAVQELDVAVLRLLGLLGDSN